MAIGTPVERYAVARTALVGSSTLSPATAVQVGTRAFLFAAGPTAAKTISSVTDDVGNTWTVDATFAGATDNVAVASCRVTTQIGTSNVITINWSSATSANRQIWIQEVSGVGVFDKSAAAAGTSTTPSSGNTATLSQADELVWGLVRFNTATWTKGATYTNPTTSVLSTGTGLEYKIVAATTAVAADGSLSASVVWAALAATYRGGTPSLPVPSRMARNHLLRR